MSTDPNTTPLRLSSTRVPITSDTNRSFAGTIFASEEERVVTQNQEESSQTQEELSQIF